MKKIFIVSLCFILVGCTCNPPLRITPIQRDDKTLSCRGVILEINEAEYYRRHALTSMKRNAVKLYAPTCVLTGALTGKAAVDAADQRIEYLAEIYRLLQCAGKPMDPPTDIESDS